MTSDRVPPSGEVEPAPSEADRLARRLIDDVAAFEVDPPAPARVTQETDSDG